MLPGEIKNQGSARGGLAAAQARGAAARARWISEGLVVPGLQVALAWGIPHEMLAMAAANGEVVSIDIDGRLYCPDALRNVDRLTVSPICLALRHLEGTEKLMFWLREHGALGGRDPAAALRGGAPIAKVTALAEAWARERTEPGGPVNSILDSSCA